MQAPDSAYIARIVAGRESAAEDAEDIEEAAAVIAKRIIYYYYFFHVDFFIYHRFSKKTVIQFFLPASSVVSV